MTLEVHNLHKSFAHNKSRQHVLRNVSLTVQPGEFVSLIGHSGCGKSTLLSVMAGLITADRDSISIDGAPVTGPGPDRAVVFQHYSLLPRLSLLNNVRVAVHSARPDRSKEKVDTSVERYLTAVGLWEHKDKRPAQVSGGMQQRCAVARAFAVEPRALLLDEPFGALDALTRARLQSQLITLWGSESDTEIVVMVTHGIDEAILLSDRIVVMQNPPGESIAEIINVAIDRPRDRVSIADHPAHRAVQERLLALLQREDASRAA
jgi:nitrate ABC transporter ATP-binding subunit